MARVNDFEVGKRYLVRITNEPYGADNYREIKILEKTVSKQYISINFQTSPDKTHYWYDCKDIEYIEELE